MKLWKKILIVVSIILCVGILGASIARTAVKPVTISRSGSGSSAPASTSTEEPEESLGLEDLGYRIPVFVSSSMMDHVRVFVHDEEIPSSGVASLPNGYADSKGGNSDSKGGNTEPEDPDPVYVDYYVFYIDPDDSEVILSRTSNLSKPADAYAHVMKVPCPNLYDFSYSESDLYFDEVHSSPASITDFSDALFVVIY